MPDPQADPNAPAPTAYPALFDALLAQVPGTVGDAERAFFASRINDDTAQRDGDGVESASVLDESLLVVRPALAAVMARKVPGYGPLRLRYLLDLNRELAGYVAALDTAVVEAAGASAARTTSLQGSRVLRRVALRALKNLAGRDKAQRARVRKASEEIERPDERARSLEAIAQELEAVVANVPPAVAEDAGATPGLMAGLRTYAKAVLEARERAKGTRGSVFSLYDLMNLLDGKILHELRALAGSMRDARRSDKEIPAVRVKLLSRSGKKKAKAKAGDDAKPAGDAKPGG